MKRFFVKALAVLLACMFVISGINFSILADDDTPSSADLGDKLVAMNVAISGQIKMLFYFTNVENVSYYEIRVPQRDGTEKVTKVAKSSLEYDSAKGRYLLTVPLVAAQQAVDITITPYDANGTVGKVRKHSIKEYANKIIDLDAASDDNTYHTAAEALKSMLNYGAMAQLSFGYNKENLANDGLYFGSTNPVNNMSTSNLYGVKDYVYNTTDASKLGFSSMNAYLEDTVAIRCYLDYKGSVENLKVTIEGEDCGNAIYRDGDKYYVLVSNIPATKFNYQYSISVTDGENTVNLKYSVLNYVKSFVVQPDKSEADINTAYSMFLYYARMSEYANGEVAEKPSACDHKRSYVDLNRDYAEICSDCGKDVTPTNIVENANDLANGVTTYFGKCNVNEGGTVNTAVDIDKDRNNYVVENSNMNVYYPLTNEEKQNLTVTNKNGGVYVQDTMDVYVKTANGTYWSSNSTNDATANLFRYGYYYYDVHAYGQNFVEDGVSTEPTATESYSLQNFYDSWGLTKYAHDMSIGTSRSNAKNGIDCTITSTTDPYIYAASSTGYKTSTYNAVQITMTLESTSKVDLRRNTSSGSKNFTDENMIVFETMADGKEHTYTIYFNEQATIYGLRLDFNGQSGEKINVKSINFVTINLGTAPELLLDRGLHTYTDKMHQVLSIVAPKADVTGIQEIGMVTKIKKSTVNAVKVKVAGSNTLLTAISNTVSNVEYVGFDVANAGIFGYILPADDSSGTITITDDGTNYVITQTVAPKNGTIKKQDTLSSKTDFVTKYPNFKGTSLNIYNSPNAFYFGQRIYTDDSHDFATFLEQAYIERNPLTAENIKIDTDKTPNATFDGYDAIRGMYAFTIPENIGFNAGYYYAQNFNGAVSFSITGDDRDRNMYVMAYSYGCCVEGGAVLDSNDQMLPIPTEVSKNFDHEFEEPIWLWGDVGYSEVRIPVSVKAGETEELTVLQMYMNWGQYPLKQISSIQFFAPYYHLSTGVTESNCIANYYVKGKDLQTLPDHRAASAPFWSNADINGDGFNEGDPQHDNGGFHYFLQYTSTEGKFSSEPTNSVINSAGLTYADIDMTYVSDDGKIEVTYKHLEMPQTDENRAYYTMQYTVKEAITINEFYKNFSFYSVRGYGDGYAKLGYWGANGAVADIKTNTSGTKYVLGTDCPYFDMYDIQGNGNNTQNADVSFLIYNSFVDLNADKKDDGVNFAVYEKNRLASLTLNIDGTQVIAAGATITINAIVMPWCNQDYRNGDTSGAPDQNVRDVRENSLLDPIVANGYDDNTTKVENVFLPTVKTTNGLDATFTIGHFNNNVTVSKNINVTFRVDGFKVLTTPKLYETTDNGETWQLVEISSANTPDITGNAHNYDGYAVYYDKDTKTYSYSFVTTIMGETARTFKVIVDDTYVEWEEKHGDLYYGADAIYHFALHGSNIKASTLKSENGVDYVTIQNNNSNDPTTSSFKVVGGSAAKYMVLKYRINSGNTRSGLQFYMTTSGTYDGIADNFELNNSVVKQNGTWQVMVVDLAALVAEKKLTDMVASDVGTYTLSSFRFDPFTVASTDSIDVAYIAFCSDIYSAVEMNSDMDISDIRYVNGMTKSSPISDKLTDS